MDRLVRAKDRSKTWSGEESWERDREKGGGKDGEGKMGRKGGKRNKKEKTLKRTQERNLDREDGIFRAG